MCSIVSRLPHCPGDSIRNDLVNGGTLEKVQQLASRESAQPTKLYDWWDDKHSLDGIERITSDHQKDFHQGGSRTDPVPPALPSDAGIYSTEG